MCRTWTSLELQLVIRREVSVVLDLETIVPVLWKALSLLVAPVARSSGAEDSRVGIGRCEVYFRTWSGATQR